MTPTKTRKTHSVIRISKKAHEALAKLAAKNNRSLVTTVDILVGVK